MANQFLALSMFIMLLSFFIVLNSMSNYEEEKKQNVLESLNVAFATAKITEDEAPETKEDPAQSRRKGQVLDNIEDLFNANITGLEAQRDSLGRVMTITMPVWKFEQSLRDSGGTGGAFGKTLASMLMAEGRIAYRMDMVLQAGNPAQMVNQNPEEASSMAKKVSSFAAILEDIGLPRKLTTAGLGQGDEGMIALYFRRHEPFVPLEYIPEAQEGSRAP